MYTFHISPILLSGYKYQDMVYVHSVYRMIGAGLLLDTILLPTLINTMVWAKHNIRQIKTFIILVSGGI